MKNLMMLILCGFMIAGCKEVDHLLTFRISNQADLTIENASPLNLPIEIITPDVTTNSTQEFQNNNTRADLVKDVKLEELKLSILSPTGKTFSFLKSIHVYISTNSNDEIQLAYLDNITSTANSISLTVTTQKLDTYIKSSSYKLRTQVVTRETLTQDIEVRANMKFRVTADPL